MPHAHADARTRARAATPLPVIEVASPCTVDWETMTGGARSRFCAHCERYVHDLSAMGSEEVIDLVCDSAGRLCVRFERTADGTVKTLDYAPPRRGWRNRYRWLVVGLLAAMGAGGAREAWQRHQQAQTTRVLGMMVPMQVPTTTGSTGPSGLPAPAAPICPTP